MAKEKLTTKISTESYKGVRDFYPEELFGLNHVFKVWREVAESFGYVEYGASILEDAELYKAKSGDEIVSEQTYTFKDRGDREVTLRPEMTPTVARLVAAREQELTLPLRWYSIPNLFRYEKPQRGRLREHWQLNVDLFGIDNSNADKEILNIAYQIMKKFGAQNEDFVIKINNRKVMEAVYKKLNLGQEQSYKVSKILDKKDKISEDTFVKAIEEVVVEKTPEFVKIMNSNEKLLEFVGDKNEDAKDLINLIENLNQANIKNIIFDPTLVRGFDYYTGMVFEVFDTNEENKRSVFGGGRYDDLLDIFGSKKVPAVGFGAGDVTINDFLVTHNLLPKYRPSTDIYIAILKEDFRKDAESLTKKLRDLGINVAIDMSDKKVGDQIKIAHKQSVPYVICVGEDEVKSGLYPVKNMETGEETKVKSEEIPGVIIK